MTYLDDIAEPGTLVCDTDGDGLTINPAEGVLKARREELQREARRLATRGLKLCAELMNREEAWDKYDMYGWSNPPPDELDRVVVVESFTKRGTGKAGMYTFKTMTIELTMAFMTTEERYFSTLCHEWAHAVCHIGFPDGTRVGHSERWQAVMRAMGRTPDRCHTYSVAEAFPNRYVDVVCPYCKTSFGSVTKTKLQNSLNAGLTYGCRACKKKGITLEMAAVAASGPEIAQKFGILPKPPILNLGLDLRAELMEWNDGADDIFRLAKYEKREHLPGALRSLKKLARETSSTVTKNDVKSLIKRLEKHL